MIISNWVEEERNYLSVDKWVSLTGTISGISETAKGNRIILNNPIVSKGTCVEIDELIQVNVFANDSFEKNASKDNALYEISNNLKIGNTISLNGEAIAFEVATNPGQFDSYKYYRNKGYAYSVIPKDIQIINKKCNRYKEMLREVSKAIRDSLYKYLPENDAGIMTAMILGNKSHLAEDDKKLYEENGLMHLLAISALHVSMISTILLWIIKRLPIGIIPGRFIVIIMLIMYGQIAGYGVSCTRAIVMLLCGIVARIIGRTYDRISAMALAGIILLANRPSTLFSCEYLLSFGAVISIMLVDSIHKRVIYNNKIYKIIWDAISVNLGVFYFTMPILLFFYYDVPMYSVVLNILIIPMMSVLFVTALLCGVVGIFFSPVAMLLAGPVHFILEANRWLCNKAAESAYSLRITGFPTETKIIVYYLILAGLFVVLYKVNNNKLSLAGITTVSLLLIGVMGYRVTEGEMSLTMLDVGQGDGIYVELPDARGMFVDGGSSNVKKVGEYRIEPFLKYSGRKGIDIWVVTHGDSDHTSGLLEIMEKVKQKRFYINELWLSDVNNPGEGYQLIETKAKELGIEVKKLGFGDETVIADAKITIINPVKGFQSEGENEYSLAMLLEYGKFSGLFTGDVEKRGEQQIINVLSGRKLSLLKCAHHGSGNSTTSSFCDSIRADISLISVGKNNSYGHPDASVINRLKKMKSHIIRTDEKGAINVIINAGKMYVETYN